MPLNQTSAQLQQKAAGYLLASANAAIREKAIKPVKKPVIKPAKKPVKKPEKPAKKPVKKPAKKPAKRK